MIVASIVAARSSAAASSAWASARRTARLVGARLLVGGAPLGAVERLA